MQKALDTRRAYGSPGGLGRYSAGASRDGPGAEMGFNSVRSGFLLRMVLFSVLEYWSTAQITSRLRANCSWQPAP